MKDRKPAYGRMVLLVMFVFLCALTACGTSQYDPDTAATNIIAEEFANQTAEAPTNTTVPTDTLVPTNTPVPTDTPIPTQTPTPTDSPTPTITNTPPSTETTEPTIPPEPTLGEILFFDDDFEAPTDEFKLGVAMVYACFEYWNIEPGLRVSGYAYHNGKEWANISTPLDLEGNDYYCFTLSIGGGKARLDPGS